jgi:hypothetical protein
MFIIEIIASSRTEQEEQGCGNDMTVLVGELCKKAKAKKNKCFRRKAEKEKEKTKRKKKKEKTASQDPSEYGWTPSYCHQPL